MYNTWDICIHKSGNVGNCKSLCVIAEAIKLL